MRKKYFILLLLVLFTFLFFLSSDNNEESINKIGYIQFINGNVKVIHEGNDSQQPVKINDIVFIDDTFITDKESEIEIKLIKNESILTIYENSNLKIESILDENDNKKTLLSLIFGKIKNVVTKLKGGDEFIIQTPSGQASVRGTEFIVATSELGETVVQVDQGEVVVANDEGLIIVKKGDQSILDIDKNPQILKKKLIIDKWLKERKKALKKEGIKKIIFLYKKVYLFDKKLKELEEKLNEIYLDKDFQKILNKKKKGITLTKYEVLKWKLFRKKVRALIYPSSKTINSMSNILNLIKNIGDKIELKKIEEKNIYNKAKKMILDIRRVRKKLLILYKITSY